MQLKYRCRVCHEYFASFDIDLVLDHYIDFHPVDCVNLLAEMIQDEGFGYEEVTNELDQR